MVDAGGKPSARACTAHAQGTHGTGEEAGALAAPTPIGNKQIIIGDDTVLDSQEPTAAKCALKFIWSDPKPEIRVYCLVFGGDAGHTLQTTH